MSARTVGYAALMGEIRLGDFGDPWGTAMAWLFALASVVYVETGECLPEYQPSPMLDTREDLEEDDYPTSITLDLYDDANVTLDDMRDVFTVMSRYADWCKLAGKDY